MSDLQRLWEIARYKPSVVQNLFDPFIQDFETRLFCKDHGMVYMGYRSVEYMNIYKNVLWEV